MLKESLTVVSVVSVDKSEVDPFLAALFTEVSGPTSRPVEYIALHPTLTEQTKIVDQRLYSADDKNDYFAIYSPSEDQFAAFFSSLRKRYKSSAVHGSHRLSRRTLTEPKQSKEDAGLVENRVALELAIAPGRQEEGWAFSFAREIPLEAISLLQYALTVCCALGSDGCSPLAGVVVRVVFFDPHCSDAFAFRQRAAVYRAVRRGFLKALA